MNKEKVLLMTALISRIFHPISRLTVFMSQKSELLPHSFFFDCFRSKVIFRVTQNSPAALLCSLENLALRGCRPYQLRPMVAVGKVSNKPSVQLPMVADLSACPVLGGTGNYSIT